MANLIRQRIQLGLYTILLTCAACSHEQADLSPSRTSESDDSAKKSFESEDRTRGEKLSLDQQVSGAISDLAKQTGIDARDISLKQARTVHWRSGALGCPKAGMAYLQSIVPGVLVILEADGRHYRYHGRMEDRLFHCPDARAKPPAYGPGKAFM